MKDKLIALLKLVASKSLSGLSILAALLSKGLDSLAKKLAV